MRIQKVINSCHQCEFLKKMQHLTSNCFYAGVCNYEKEDEETVFRSNLLVCVGGNSDIFNRQIDIPKECPLEEYLKPALK
jgi:hypothetical protein